MSIIRWLHFSDLHLNNDKEVETCLMREELPEYLSQLDLQFHYVFCTGDIREHSIPYPDSTVPYLKKLCGSLGVPIDRFFVVPGNHDVDASNVDRTNLIKKLTNWEEDYYNSRSGIIQPEDFALLSEGRGAFCSLMDELYSGLPNRAKYYHDKECPHFLISTDDLNILHLDTTLTYYPKNERNFVVGTSLLKDLLDKCDSQKTTVLITHYSFDFLTQAEKKTVRKLLDHANVRLWIAGHEHDQLIRKQQDIFWECQCGNLALQKGAKSCVLIGELNLDTGEGKVSVHAWYPDEGWGKYPFARIFSEDNSLYPFSISRPDLLPSMSIDREWENANEALSVLESEGGIFQGFVLSPTILPSLQCSEKRFENDIYASEEGTSRDGSVDFPLRCVMRHLWEEKGKDPMRTCHGLLLGDGGMGKSTMMFQECRDLLRNDHRLAVYLSLQSLEGTGRGIKQAILEVLYKENGDESKLTHLIRERHDFPDLTIFIDGFNELGSAAAQRFVAEIKDLVSYAGVQIIVSSRLNFLKDFGLRQFRLVETCDLNKNQIFTFFKSKPIESKNIYANDGLRTLLKNPMMVLLYAQTCPIMERHSDIDYLNWNLTVSNGTDILYNFYLAQAAVLLDRAAPDMQYIFKCLVLIHLVLPFLGYHAVKENMFTWTEAKFENLLSAAVREVNDIILGEALPAPLRLFRRRHRLQVTQLIEDDVYSLLISELCLLRRGHNLVSFPHQIFRDYLAANYLFSCLIKYKKDDVWHNELIGAGIVQHLRNLPKKNPWGDDGFIKPLLDKYRGKEAEERDYMVANLIECWIPTNEYVEGGTNSEYDLSELDLRRISLADKLKDRSQCIINIDRAMVSRGTFINEKRHDCIIAMAFSHDARMLAAVSRNGLVSVTNIAMQSQMIIGELQVNGNVELGFDEEDRLMLKNNQASKIWPTIAYDIIEDADAGHTFKKLISMTHEAATHVEILHTHLEESGLLGILDVSSEDGQYIAVGFESGYIQVWETTAQKCIANLSLGDSHITTASFMPDGSIAAIGSGRNLIQLWDMKSGRCFRIIHFSKPIQEVRFPDYARTLECHYSDGRYRSYDITTMKFRKTEEARPPFVSNALSNEMQKIRERIARFDSAPNGNAIVLTSSGKAYTWDEQRKHLSLCEKHQLPVKAIAICKTDGRFAASYSDEQLSMSAREGSVKARKELNGQRVIRIRIVKTGQCQRRLPTRHRTIKRIQFYTANRIVLAGFATDGSIMLWELINRKVGEKEWGTWNSLGIIGKNQSEPLECTVSKSGQEFIAAYTDGAIVIRSFINNNSEHKIQTFPGVDPNLIKWKTLKGDQNTIDVLQRYRH